MMHDSSTVDVAPAASPTIATSTMAPTTSSSSSNGADDSRYLISSPLISPTLIAPRPVKACQSPTNSSPNWKTSYSDDELAGLEMARILNMGSFRLQELSESHGDDRGSPEQRQGTGATLRRNPSFPPPESQTRAFSLSNNSNSNNGNGNSFHGQMSHLFPNTVVVTQPIPSSKLHQQQLAHRQFQQQQQQFLQQQQLQQQQQQQMFAKSSASSAASSSISNSSSGVTSTLTQSFRAAKLTPAGGSVSSAENNPSRINRPNSSREKVNVATGNSEYFPVKILSLEDDE